MWQECLVGYAIVALVDLFALSEAHIASQLLLETSLQLLLLGCSVGQNGIQINFFELLPLFLGTFDDELSQVVARLCTNRQRIINNMVARGDKIYLKDLILCIHKRHENY